MSGRGLGPGQDLLEQGSKPVPRVALEAVSPDSEPGMNACKLLRGWPDQRIEDADARRISGMQPFHAIGRAFSEEGDCIVGEAKVRQVSANDRIGFAASLPSGRYAAWKPTLLLG